MDVAPEELQFLGSVEIVRESISIPKYSPRNLYLITLTLIFPLSLAILGHSLFTHPILGQLNNPLADPARMDPPCRIPVVLPLVPVWVLAGFDRSRWRPCTMVGLLVQSVFYYVCKSFHHQGIDKTALHHHLGAYLGDYVPLKTNIQMENLDI